MGKKRVATFKYYGSDRSLRYEKERWEWSENGERKKSFCFWHPNGRDRRESSRGGPPVLYAPTPDYVSTLTDSKTVCICEGEAKADRLKEFGYVATSLDAGAGSRITEEIVKQLAGKEILFFPDNDKPGKDFAQRLALKLYGHVEWFKIVNLPQLKPKEDVLDWLKEGKPGDEDPLAHYIDKARKWKPPSEKKQNDEETKELLDFPIDFEEMYYQVIDFISQRVSVDFGVEWILAGFAINSHVYDVYDTTPYLLLESAGPSCGKSTAISVLASICARSKVISSPTPAVLFRTTAKEKPTLFIDEGEQLRMRTENSMALKEILQSGYKKGGVVQRCEGSNYDLRSFEVYCPKVIAAIGGLKDALLDRCIVVSMTRSLKKLKSSTVRALKRDSPPILKMLKAFALQYKAELEALYEKMPDESYWPQFRDREAELFTPLLIAAKLAGDPIENKMVQVASKCSSRKQKIAIDETPDLAAIEELALVAGNLAEDQERMQTAELVEPLRNCEGYWAKRLKGGEENKRSDASAIGSFLKRFRERLGKKTRTEHGTTYDAEELLHVLSQELSTDPFPVPRSDLQVLQDVPQVSVLKGVNNLAGNREPVIPARGLTHINQEDTGNLAGLAGMAANHKGTREAKVSEKERQAPLSAKEADELWMLERQRRIENGEKW